MKQTTTCLGAVACVVLVCGVAVIAGWKHQSQQLGSMQQRQEPGVVTIASDGNVYLTGKQQSVDELRAALTGSRVRKPAAPGIPLF